MSVKRILVTGSSGTIGTRLCERLLKSGYDVIGIDAKPNKWHKEINERTVIGDIRDKTAFEKLPKDFDMVIHLAANARVFNLVVDPSMARDNFEMLFNTLEFTRKSGIKKFIFASSREVYGNSGHVIHSEDEAYVKNCESPYTASKVGGEALVHSYQQCYGIDFIIVRFSNVYGMYDGSDRLLPLFIQKTCDGEDLHVYGKDKVLDFTFVDDAVNGVLKCIEKFDGVRNDVFNIASGTGTTILEVAEHVIKHMKGKNKVVIEDNRTGEVVKYIADIWKARERLGYEPKVSIETGVKKSIEWYMNGLYHE
jgi:nucleoside-diphosphate-sugar epimerase